MTYKRPKDDELENAIVDVLLRNQFIYSQNDFAKLVMRELNKSDVEYRVSGERVRVFAIEHGMVGVNIDYRDCKKKKDIAKCPVCRHPLESIKNATLDGDIIEIRRRCTFCNYVSSARGSIPARYTFVRKGRGISL